MKLPNWKDNLNFTAFPFNHLIPGNEVVGVIVDEVASSSGVIKSLPPLNKMIMIQISLSHLKRKKYPRGMQHAHNLEI